MFTWGVQQIDPGFDPFRANVVLMLHGDGLNGSTTFTDSSPLPKTMTAFGAAALSTSSKRFGSASLSFPTTSSFSATATSTDYDLGSGDFTIECWAYLNTLGADTNMVAKWLAGGDSFIFGTNGTALIFIYVVGGTQFTVSAAGTVSIGSWMHLAVTRTGTTLRLFVNGLQVQSASIIGAIVYSAASSLFVGFGTTVNMLLDDVRITKGVSRYTASFTPPTAPFPDVGP